MNVCILNSVLLKGKLANPYIHCLYSFMGFVPNCQMHCHTFTMDFIQRDACILTSHARNAWFSRSPEKAWVCISFCRPTAEFFFGCKPREQLQWNDGRICKTRAPIWLPPSFPSHRCNSCFSFAHGVQTISRLPAARAQQHRGNWVVGCHILFVSLKRQNQRRIVVCIFNLAALLCLQPCLIRALLKGNKILPLLVVACPHQHIA